MTSQGYRDWVREGRPYTLIRPAKQVQAALRAHGLTVYDYPNPAHLQASTPEDHTPFSATGWPGANRRWKARALDVMPRSDSLAHRKENADIARQLIRDRDAGLPAVMWIKYLNWTDEDGVCRQERWMDAGAPLLRKTRSSTDKGHIHVSGRSDADDDTHADGYDPIARMTGGDDMAAVQETDRSYNDLIYAVSALVDGAPVAARKNADGSTSPARPNSVAGKLDRLLAAAAADEVRDAATLAAIQAVTSGGGPDAAPIVQAIRDATAETHGYITQLQADLTAAREEEARLRQALAEALKS